MAASFFMKTIIQTGGEVSDGVQPFFEIPPHLLVSWSKRKEILTKSQLEKALAGMRDSRNQKWEKSNGVMLNTTHELS